MTKAIPQMAKGANNEELSAAFEAHLKETERQIDRLEQVAKLLGTTTSGKKCKGMAGVIAEGAEAHDEDGDENVLDLGIIGAGSRVEHYRNRGLHDGDQSRDATSATMRIRRAAQRKPGGRKGCRRKAAVDRIADFATGSDRRKFGRVGGRRIGKPRKGESEDCGTTTNHLQRISLHSKSERDSVKV